VSVPPSGAPAASRRGAAAAGAAAATAVLALLGAGVVGGFGPQQRLDAAVSHAFYAGDARPGWLEALLQVVTAPGLTAVRVVVLAPVVGWLLRRAAWWTAAWVATAALLVGPLTSLLKVGFDRVRPQFAHGGAQLSSLSFPSGHSSGVATLVTVGLVLGWPLLARGVRRRVLAAGVALIVVVGLSRMWLGVHYLTDVLGGWSLGVAWSLAVALAFDALPGGRAALVPRPPAEVAPR
jgi:membrane-associated phospholipid phosphatase